MGVRAGVHKYGVGDRRWLFVECDGGIYSIVEKLVFNVFHCELCHESVFGFEEFMNHRCRILYDLDHTREFDWIIPLPGLLHIEMNGCKAFFELNWEVFLKSVCTLLGFSSLKALDYAKRCSDHHKSWELLQILYIAVADELLVPYVRYCRENHKDVSEDGYWDWSASVIDHNYLYIQQMVLTFIHALMLFRTGCRKGNSDAIISGLDKLSLLFYGRQYPRYQRIITMNKYINVMMPEELRNVVNSFTLSRTGNTGHYQSGDACLEEINKSAKAWVKQTGVPLDNNWLKVFRNLDNVNEVSIMLISITMAWVHLFDLLLYTPANRNGHVGTLPAVYGTQSTQHLGCHDMQSIC